MSYGPGQFYDVLLERGARGLVGGDALLGGGDLLPRRFEPRLELELVLGFGRELLARGVGGAVESLQGDESFQIGMHGSVSQKKGPAEAEPEFYML